MLRISSDDSKPPLSLSRPGEDNAGVSATRGSADHADVADGYAVHPAGAAAARHLQGRLRFVALHVGAHLGRAALRRLAAGHPQRGPIPGYVLGAWWVDGWMDGCRWVLD